MTRNRRRRKKIAGYALEDRRIQGKGGRKGGEKEKQRFESVWLSYSVPVKRREDRHLLIETQC